MPTDIVIPTLGESISEGVVSAWLKEEGEHVERDEPILELETDKITMEVPSPAAGVLKHGAKQGDTVTVGAVVGAIGEGEGKPSKGGKSESKSASKSEAKSESKSEAKSEAKSEDKSKDETKRKAADGEGSKDSGKPSTQVVDAPRGSGGDDEGVPATPLARKLAEEHGVRLSSISGTGAGGRVREQDVLAYIQTHQAATSNGAPRPGPGAGAGAGSSAAARTIASASRGVTHEKMSPLRQRVAARLVEAQRTAAMLTTFNECDMTNVMALRSAHKDAFEKKHGVKLGFMSFFVKASASALQAFPRVNSFIIEKDGAPIIEGHEYCDIAIAVGTKKGLVVPVLRNCESRSFAEVETGVLELADKARDGKLTLEDMSGGTFTISNGGVYGSMMSTPILNPPQSGILGMHNIVRRPVEDPAKPGSGEVVVRPMMYLALSYDHRMVDGAEAVGFLKHIKECIEAPERLLIGV